MDIIVQLAAIHTYILYGKMFRLNDYGQFIKEL